MIVYFTGGGMSIEALSFRMLAIGLIVLLATKATLGLFCVLRPVARGMAIHA